MPNIIIIIFHSYLCSLNSFKIMTGFFLLLPPIKLHRNWIPNGAQKPSISTLWIQSQQMLLLSCTIAHTRWEIKMQTHNFRESRVTKDVWFNDGGRRVKKNVIVFWIRINKFRYASKFTYLDHIHIHVSCYKNVVPWIFAVCIFSNK